jgi:hypothetical protein
MQYVIWSGNHAEIHLFQHAVHPFNYTGDLGRNTAGSVNYEIGWATIASLLKWLHIFPFTYKSLPTSPE